MSTLNSRDYRRLLEIICVLNAPCGLEEFPARAIESVSQLVASEHTAYNEVNLARGRIVAAIAPGSPSPIAMAALLEPHLEQHPLVSRCAHGEIELATISDFCDAKSWHKSAIYNEFFRCFDIEDQMALRLEGEAGLLLALTLQRSDRSFAERDRELLRLLRPHLNNAYVTACALSGQTATATATCGYALVNADGALIFCDERAGGFLRAFWGSDLLPDEIRVWLTEGRRSHLSAPTLQARRGGHVLNVRRGGHTPDGTLLLFDRQTFFEPLVSLQKLGLTARQSEVLLCLARGDSNSQIAARLHISSHTTKRHLEAIYARLNVGNRAAAAHRALQILSGFSWENGRQK